MKSVWERAAELTSQPQQWLPLLASWRGDDPMTFYCVDTTIAGHTVAIKVYVSASGEPTALPLEERGAFVTKDAEIAAAYSEDAVFCVGDGYYLCLEEAPLEALDDLRRMAELYIADRLRYFDVHISATIDSVPVWWRHETLHNGMSEEEWVERWAALVYGMWSAVSLAAAVMQTLLRDAETVQT